MNVTRFEQMNQLPFAIRAIELGWTSHTANSRARRWFYFYAPDKPRLVLHLTPESETNLYTVGRDTTNSEAEAIKYLERTTGA